MAAGLANLADLLLYCTTLTQWLTEYPTLATALVQPQNLPSPKKSRSRSEAIEKRLGPSKASSSERLKTVMGRLPSNLPEQIFCQSVQT